MKITYNGKRYDTTKCRQVASRDLHSYSNNYAGSTTLYVASDGAFILETDSNGQDCHITDDISVVGLEEAREWMEGARMDEAEEAIAVEVGLIEIVK